MTTGQHEPQRPKHKKHLLHFHFDVTHLHEKRSGGEVIIIIVDDVAEDDQIIPLGSVLTKL